MLLMDSEPQNLYKKCSVLCKTFAGIFVTLYVKNLCMLLHKHDGTLEMRKFQQEDQ